MRVKRFHDSVQPKIFFGYLLFAVAPFPIKFECLADSTLSGIRSRCSIVRKTKLGIGNLNRENTLLAKKKDTLTRQNEASLSEAVIIFLNAEAKILLGMFK